MSRCSFTMLEMMVALVIMSLIGSLVAVQTAKLIRVHRFEKEIADLFIAMQEAQVLAVTYQSDITLHFKKQGGQFQYRLFSDEPFAKPLFSQENVPLSPSTTLSFNRKKSSDCSFEIYSDGTIEPKGILSFASSEVATQIDVDLSGGSMLKFSKKMKPAPG